MSIYIRERHCHHAIAETVFLDLRTIYYKGSWRQWSILKFQVMTFTSAPLCQKLKARFQTNYSGLGDDDSEPDQPETNVFDPRHQEVNS